MKFLEKVLHKTRLSRSGLISTSTKSLEHDGDDSSSVSEEAQATPEFRIVKGYQATGWFQEMPPTLPIADTRHEEPSKMPTEQAKDGSLAKPMQMLIYEPTSPVDEGALYHRLIESDEIRLIVLRSGRFSSPVQCSLVHARLDEQPRYDALSYVWGLEQDTDVVQVNGLDHLVGKNLFQALQHLRLPNEDRYLWIDALCINQLDDRERGHQVAQMGMIYSRATTVRLWLGLANPFTQATFSLISHIYHNERSSHIFDNSTRNEFISLSTRPYWSRLWVIQEIVLASQIEIHCGSLQIPWAELAAICAENPEALDEIRLSRMTDLCRQRQIAKNKTHSLSARTSLLFLVENHRQAECSDVRDKIYGLHGFAPKCCRDAVPVDYSCSAFHLCERVLRHETHSHRAKDGSFMRRSADLHHLIIQGAVQQQGSRMAFDIETQRPSGPKPSLLTRLEVTASETGDVVWVSPQISHIWSNGRDLEVPVNLIHSEGLERSLKERSVIEMSQRHRRVNKTHIPERPYQSYKSDVQTISMPAIAEERSSPIRSDRTLMMLRNLICSLQQDRALEKGFLVLEGSQTGSRLLYTQANVKVRDSVVSIRNRGSPIFFLVDRRSRDRLNKLVGYATAFQPVPTHFNNQLISFEMYLSAILEYSRAAVWDEDIRGTT